MSKATHSLIIDACEASWLAHCNDCSGFARAVALQCGVFLNGNADDITGYIGSAGIRLPSAAEARRYAKEGFLVLAGLAEAGHGHVVVVVHDPTSNSPFPTAYWGRLHEFKAPDGKTYNFGMGRKFMSLNYAWSHALLPRVVYGAIKPVRLLMEPRL